MVIRPSHTKEYKYQTQSSYGGDSGAWVCNRLREEYPDANTWSHLSSYDASVNISGFPPCNDTQYMNYCTYRFVGPSVPGHPQPIEDPDGILGYWAIRAPRYRFRFGPYVFDGRDDTCCDPQDSQTIGVRIEAWLLDQHFDYKVITWNNPPQFTGLKVTVDRTFSANSSASEASGIGTIWYHQYAFVDIPNLISDGLPVPIYGLACKISILLGASACESAYAGFLWDYFYSMDGSTDGEYLPKV